MFININSIEYLLITLNQILTAGIAITAIALLIFAFQFNLRDKVAKTFALILICVAIIFSTESISGTVKSPILIETLLRIEWVGIIILPATYLHFSDAVLATTGKPSRWKRYWAVRISYLICVLFLISLPFPSVFGKVYYEQPSAPQLQPTIITLLFSGFYLLLMAMSWFNFIRAYRRTTTKTSRRRMAYLVTGALAPAFGSFPFMLFGAGIASQFSIIFWLVAVVSNILVGGLVIVMAYAVAFFGVPWSDRVVKSRLFRWILRGPLVVNLTLGITTIVRRAGEAFGSSYTAFVPITMVISLLGLQYMITLLSPLFEKWLFYGSDRADLDRLRNFEDRYLTKNDLNQFMELILAAMCDRLQSPGGFLAVMKSNKIEMMINIGHNRYHQEDVSNGLKEMVSQKNGQEKLFLWGNDLVIPLVGDLQENESMLGLLGLTDVGRTDFDEEQLTSIELLTDRATMVLQDRLKQEQVFDVFQTLQPEMEMINRMRAAGRYDGSQLLLSLEDMKQGDMAQWVKDALTHYWGGPRLTQSPLLKFKVVLDALEKYEGSSTNALRAILREAIERVRPEGDRRFTAEWILYNILEMKFVEGRKVRDIAIRLAMSEADLYRKQRVAIETIAREITEMEMQARINLT